MTLARLCFPRFNYGIETDEVARILRRRLPEFLVECQQEALQVDRVVRWRAERFE